MKKKFFGFLCVSLTAGLFCACQISDDTDGPAQLSVDATEVSIGADNALTKDPFVESTLPFTDTIWVSASRSWTAVVETADGGDWVQPNVNERINVTGHLERFPLVMSFDRYRGSQPRSATVTLYGVDIEAPVVVTYTQEAFVPFLELEAFEGNNLVTAGNAECYVVVRCNTAWTASVDAGASTVVPSLSATAGTDSGVILLSFPENVDDEKARIARLVVNASGCEPCHVDLIQTQSERYFMLSAPVPDEVEPYIDELNIPLRSNGPWVAELTECTFENARLVPSSGLQALDGFIFSADHGADPDVAEKHAVVTIRREGMDPIVVRFSQRGSIHLKFITRNPDYVWDSRDYYSEDTPYRPYESSDKVFAYPESFPYNYTSATYKGMELECETLSGGYLFTLYGQDCGVWFNSAEFGLCVGKLKGDFVQFPEIDGRRLARMYYEASCKAMVPYTVRSESGDIVKGGEYSVTKQVSPLNSEHHDVHVHNFPETVAGERYRLTLEEDLRFISIKELCLVYE